MPLSESLLGGGGAVRGLRFLLRFATADESLTHGYVRLAPAGLETGTFSARVLRLLARWV